MEKQEVEVHEIEITPEMIEAGGWAYDYWRCYREDDADRNDVVRSIFNIMLAVGRGQLSVDSVKSQINPNTGHEFFQTTVERVPD